MIQRSAWWVDLFQQVFYHIHMSGNHDHIVEGLPCFVGSRIVFFFFSLQNCNKTWTILKLEFETFVLKNWFLTPNQSFNSLLNKTGFANSIHSNQFSSPQNQTVLSFLLLKQGNIDLVLNGEFECRLLWHIQLGLLQLLWVCPKLQFHLNT